MSLLPVFIGVETSGICISWVMWTVEIYWHSEL